MQLDMHYYGTFAMARAAGLAEDTAKLIATCAQFVDDNVADGSVEFKDGARIDAEATAHHAIDVENLLPHDQRQVWVPFHFLPGNEGEDYTERLKCRMDSAVAREMLDHHLDLAGTAYGPALIGIAAHVYADTFSHYGFSGVSSRGNRVVNESFRFDEGLDPDIRNYITDKAASFFAEKTGGGLFANIKSWMGENLSGALGHGSVATYPDRPYLSWGFDYERPDAVHGQACDRSNPSTFLVGCRALHDVFRRFAEAAPGEHSSGDGRDFDSIEGSVSAVLATQASKEGRIDAWREAARSGEIFGSEGANIPDYEGHAWNDRWSELDETERGRDALSEPVWLFYQAAALHRTYVLRDLLPRHGLVVD